GPSGSRGPDRSSNRGSAADRRGVDESGDRRRTWSLGENREGSRHRDLQGDECGQSHPGCDARQRDGSYFATERPASTERLFAVAVRLTIAALSLPLDTGLCMSKRPLALASARRSGAVSPVIRIAGLVSLYSARIRSMTTSPLSPSRRGMAPRMTAGF